MYEKIVLPNGVRVIYERMPNVRSAAVGIWVMNGSRYEPEEWNGISHFVEHMVFKGTEKRSAKHIAVAMDAIGGQVNAFTTKECTCFYLRTLDSHLQTGVEILADMFLNSRFDDRDVDLERSVIEEEIDMYEDSPEDTATEKLFEQCYRGSSLGRSILGHPETLKDIHGKQLHEFVDEFYRPQDTIVSLAGSFTLGDIEFICSLFEGMKGEGRNVATPVQYHPTVFTKEKDIEQNHICIGFEGVPLCSDERYVNALLGTILGGGMSSRLFQRVREQNGLCYSIYSFHTAHTDAGLFSVYTALGQETEQRAVELILQECRNLAECGPDRTELNRCKEQAKTSVLLGLESTASRMNQIARGEMFFGYNPEVEEVIARYDAVTKEDVAALARQIFQWDQMSISAVGRIESEKYYADLIRQYS
ncbi:MAG: pitrilysin family protein [Eubacteriales bacterium]|nr:pitrilysin family protein [Eubacteriales bacterium]